MSFFDQEATQVISLEELQTPEQLDADFARRMHYHPAHRAAAVCGKVPAPDRSTVAVDALTCPRCLQIVASEASQRLAVIACRPEEAIGIQVTLAPTMERLVRVLRAGARVPRLAGSSQEQLEVWIDLMRALYTGKVTERLWGAAHRAVIDLVPEVGPNG